MQHAVVVEGYADHIGPSASASWRWASTRTAVVVAAHGEKKASDDASSLDRRVVFFATDRGATTQIAAR